MLDGSNALGGGLQLRPGAPAMTWALPTSPISGSGFSATSTAVGALYTQVHPPKTIRLVYPAVSPAAEAYVFMLMLSAFPVGSVHRLGGWPQTSVTPSPLCRQQFEEQRRLLRGLCVNCGGGHRSKDFTSPSRGVEYACPACRQRMLITSRGASVDCPRAAALPPAPSRAPPPPPPPTAAVGPTPIPPQPGPQRTPAGGARNPGHQP